MQLHVVSNSAYAGVNMFKLVSTKLFSDRHHFDNPVYSTTSQVASGGGPPSGQGSCPGRTSNPQRTTNHFPLNNGCSRVINNFSTASTSSGANAAKKHVNIEREKLAMTSNHTYHEDDTEDEVGDRGNDLGLLSVLGFLI